MTGMTTTASIAPAVPAGGRKKGVNPFAKKGKSPKPNTPGKNPFAKAGPIKGAPAPKGKAGPIDPRTLGSMKASLGKM